jgi:hypothetical protein
VTYAAVEPRSIMRLCWSIGLVVGMFFCGQYAAAWTQEVYVWQRQNGPALAAALDATRASVDGFHVLAAEVAWRAGRPQIVRPALDYVRLAKLGRPVGLVLRVGPYGGPFSVDDAAAGALKDLASTLLIAAREGGLVPAELQIDFDCAEAKLAGFRVWLTALREAVGTTKLVFTALPAWLKHDEFIALAHAADGFVLQVHSLEKPAGADQPFTLCDPERARVWIDQASRVGVAFRVALPTYGYTIAFDRGGKFIGLSAEGPRPEWPAGTQVRVVRADSRAMAQLSRKLAASPPPHCAGAIWFRLPVEGDRLNWAPITLQAILAGEVPDERLTVQVEWSERGLAEIFVVNEGETTEPMPSKLTLRWPPGERLLASDGVGGFRLEMRRGQEQAAILAAHVPPDALLSPGQRGQVAWFRFSHELSLETNLPAPP